MIPLKVQHELATMGWHSVTVWECELKPIKREKTLKSLAYTLNRIFLQDRTVKRYEIPDDEPTMQQRTSAIVICRTVKFTG
jgi:DNA mismatch endonuclease (patch repair protein)